MMVRISSFCCIEIDRYRNICFRKELGLQDTRQGKTCKGVTVFFFLSVPPSFCLLNENWWNSSHSDSGIHWMDVYNQLDITMPALCDFGTSSETKIASNLDKQITPEIMWGVQKQTNRFNMTNLKCIKCVAHSCAAIVLITCFPQTTTQTPSGKHPCSKHNLSV